MNTSVFLAINGFATPDTRPSQVSSSTAQGEKS